MARNEEETHDTVTYCTTHDLMNFHGKITSSREAKNSNRLRRSKQWDSSDRADLFSTPGFTIQRGPRMPRSRRASLHSLAFPLSHVPPLHPPRVIEARKSEEYEEHEIHNDLELRLPAVPASGLDGSEMFEYDTTFFDDSPLDYEGESINNLACLGSHLSFEIGKFTADDFL